MKKPESSAVLVLYNHIDSDELPRVHLPEAIRKHIDTKSHPRVRMDSERLWNLFVLLSGKLNLDPEQLSFTGAGRPVCEHGTLSASHSRTMGGFLFSEESCGLDIEDIQSAELNPLDSSNPESGIHKPKTSTDWVKKHRRLMEKSLSIQQVQEVRSGKRLFEEFWTAKEALRKMNEKYMDVSLSEFELPDRGLHSVLKDQSMISVVFNENSSVENVYVWFVETDFTSLKQVRWNLQKERADQDYEIEAD